MLETPPLVLRLVSEALDQDVFEVSTARVKPADLAHRHLRVAQNGTTEPSPNDLVSHPNALVAAVVDRDADISAAARSLVLARFGLRGGSHYAPDVVFVNEWVKKEFMIAVTQACVAFMEGAAMPRKNAGKGFLEEVSKEGLTNIVSVGKCGTVLDVENR